MNEATVAEHTHAIPEAIFASHEVRLAGQQWIVAAALIVLAFASMPSMWQEVEKFLPGPDYRTPYALSNDYWLFSRYSRWAASRADTLVIGDSVIWGQYVGKDQTLPHYLNQLAGQDRFVNMGVDGLHPAALAGLIKHYGRPISGRKVIVYCNLLWMSSKRHDLQVEKETPFNHPALVPQFFPRIPCYRAPWSQRVDIVFHQNVPLLGWTDHLRVAYFDQMSIPAWTTKSPYQSVSKTALRGLPPPDDGPHQEPIPWTERGMEKQDFPWVELDSSFQWGSFRKALETLQARGNRVFVVVGPFNEHMLQPASLEAYARLREGVAGWLREHGIAYYMAPALPSKHYADASHPLSEGYAALAKELYADPAFARFDADERGIASPKGGA